ncbi:hypothetical protein GBF38_012018 [Nibea albiflora]|uniref:Uncharacterized protein n=1 Tax=Nibea albiflora TaxID=240163 RepID=A0ACB7EHY2_NIBAL|nr:hypothetical protein GBF38_012018 [Nibea albiflora]
MDDVISLQPLDGTLAHNYSPRCRFIGMGDRYSAKTTGTGTNQILHAEDRLDLAFVRGNLYTVLSGSPLRSSMALARGWRGSRKGLHRLRLTCL